MNSVDRATLIDFALGRLNDAETAALARRAEEDSEFAQTLDALRRELATLDDVRPSSLFPFSRRTPRLLLAPPDAPSLAAENGPSPTSDATQDNDASFSAVEEERDERLVFLNAPPSNAVKVRRIGPVYPYYPNDAEDSVADSCAFQAVFPSPCAEAEENSENAQAGENNQAQKFAMDNKIAQDEAFAPDNEIAKDEAFATDGEVAQDEAFAADDEIAKDEAFATDGEVAQDETFAADGESEQDETFAADNEVAKDETFATDGEVAQDEAFAADGESEQDETFAADNEVAKDEAFAADGESEQDEEFAPDNEIAKDEAFATDGEVAQDEAFAADGEVAKDEAFATDGEIAKDETFAADGEVAQDEAFAKDGEVAQIETFTADGESAQVETFTADGESEQDEAFATDGEVAQDETLAADNEIAQDETLATDGEVAKDEAFAADGESEQDETFAADGESEQDETFAADGESEQDETFAADNEVAQDETLAADDEIAQGEAFATDGEGEQAEEITPFAQAPTRPSRRFPFIPKFIAGSRDARRSPFVAKRARRLDEIDVPTFADLRQTSLEENAETLDVRREKEQYGGDQFDRNNPRQLDANDKNSQETFVENRESLDVRREKGQNGGDATLDAAYWEQVALSPEERRLAELLGRRPSKVELDEYYWEPIVETSQVEYEPEKRASLFGAAGRLATAPAIAVGRATLAICGVGRRSALGSDAFAATKPRRRRQPGKISDMMISIVSGVLIAVVVVFPLMRLAVKEVFTTIAKSAVRKIGVNVAISENAPQSDLLPFISEQLVFPRYDESTELQSPDAAPLREPDPLSETLVPVDDANDPASTQPTLEPIPNVAPPTF